MSEEKTVKQGKVESKPLIPIVIKKKKMPIHHRIYHTLRGIFHFIIGKKPIEEKFSVPTGNQVITIKDSHKQKNKKSNKKSGKSKKLVQKNKGLRHKARTKKKGSRKRVGIKDKKLVKTKPVIVGKTVIGLTPKSSIGSSAIESPKIPVVGGESTSSTNNENLVMVEEEALKAKKREEITFVSDGTEDQVKKIKELERRIAGYRKITDFDRILIGVNSKGSVRASDLQRELNIGDKQFNECITILQKNGDIKVEYPLIGSMKLISVKKKSNDWD